MTLIGNGTVIAEAVSRAERRRTNKKPKTASLRKATNEATELMRRATSPEQAVKSRPVQDYDICSQAPGTW